MSLSKPEILAYAGASAVIGVIMAAIMSRQDSGASKAHLRDSDEKKVGKKVPMQRKNTSFFSEQPGLQKAKSLGIPLEPIVLDKDETMELKKLIKKQ
jgi:hypothetical protein